MSLELRPPPGEHACVRAGPLHPARCAPVPAYPGTHHRPQRPRERRGNLDGGGPCAMDSGEHPAACRARPHPAVPRPSAEDGPGASLRQRLGKTPAPGGPVDASGSRDRARRGWHARRGGTAARRPERAARTIRGIVPASAAEESRGGTAARGGARPRNCRAIAGRNGPAPGRRLRERGKHPGAHFSWSPALDFFGCGPFPGEHACVRAGARLDRASPNRPRRPPRPG